MKIRTHPVMFCIAFLCAGIFNLSCFFHPCDAAESFIVKFATVAPEGSTWINHMKAMDKRIKEKSRGQLAFRIYAGGVAGDELDVLKKMRIGQIHCAAFSGVGFGQILPEVRVMDLPFLFKNYQEADLVHSELESLFAAHFREKGFELLSWAEVGNVHLFSQSPIKKRHDLAKLKVWTWSGDPISKETFSAMGTNPIPLAITDVVTALNTGMVDTVYAPILGALALQWNLYTKFMTSLPLAHSTGAILISRDFSQKIPPDLFKLLHDEFRQAMAILTLDLRKQGEEAMKLMEKGGFTIVPTPDAADLADFHKTHDQVAQALVDKVYSKDLLNKVLGLLGRPNRVK